MKNYNKLTAIKNTKAFEDLIPTLSYNSLKEINGIIQAYEDKRIDIIDDNGDYIRDQEIIILDSTYKETGMELATLRWYCEYEEIDYMIDIYKEVEEIDTIEKIKSLRDELKIGQKIGLSFQEIYHSSYLNLDEHYDEKTECYYTTTFFNNRIEFSVDEETEYFDLWNVYDYFCGGDGEEYEITEINLDSFTLEPTDQSGRPFTLSLSEIAVGYFEIK